LAQGNGGVFFVPLLSGRWENFMENLTAFGVRSGIMSFAESSTVT